MKGTTHKLNNCFSNNNSIERIDTNGGAILSVIRYMLSSLSPYFYNYYYLIHFSEPDNIFFRNQIFSPIHLQEKQLPL